MKFTESVEIAKLELTHPLSTDDWVDLVDHLRYLANELETGEYRSRDQFTLYGRVYGSE